MYTRNSTLSVVVTLVIVMGWPCLVFAYPVLIYGGDFNLPIPAPDDPENIEYGGKGWMADAVIEIPDHLPILDLDVGISVMHTSAFDLQIFLQSPAGTRLCLNKYDPHKDFFEGANYIQTIFDDEAAIPIEDGSAPFTGRFRPMAGSLLEVFDGEDIYGSWRLQIYDMWSEDTGYLERFELIVTTPEPGTVMLLALGAGLVRAFKPLRRI